MPIHQNYDEIGFYFQFENRGKKYYFNPLNKSSIISAYNGSLKQSREIEWAKYHKYE